MADETEGRLLTKLLVPIIAAGVLNLFLGISILTLVIKYGQILTWIFAVLIFIYIIRKITK